MKKELKRELRHLYGAGILFFYYMKWPFVLGIPFLYFYLDYEKNIFLNILWIWSFALIMKDLFTIIKRFIRKERIWR